MSDEIGARPSREALLRSLNDAPVQPADRRFVGNALTDRTLPPELVEYLQASAAMIDLLLAMVSADETPEEFHARQTPQGVATVERWARASLPW